MVTNDGYTDEELRHLFGDITSDEYDNDESDNTEDNYHDIDLSLESESSNEEPDRAEIETGLKIATDDDVKSLLGYLQTNPSCTTQTALTDYFENNNWESNLYYKFYVIDGNTGNIIFNLLVNRTQLDYLDKNKKYLKTVENVNQSAYTSRFSNADWYDDVKRQNVILAGLGGIGSYVCFLLSRVSPASITLFDDDIVEASNISGQFYSIQQINSSKVHSSAINAIHFADYRSIYAMPKKITETDKGAIMICGFDNMEARKLFFNNWISYVNSIPECLRGQTLFIDGRLAAETMQVLCFTGEDTEYIQRYKEEFLFSDTEADETQCSYKQTTYCANMIGSIIVNLFINFVANLSHKGMERSLPFLTEYDAIFMEMKNEF